MNADTRIGTYDEFVKAMLADNWLYLDGKTPYILTEKNAKFISTYPIRAGGFGIFIELKCPAKTLTYIAINGRIQIPRLQHRISLRCRDDTNFEMPGRTQLSIMKLDYKGKVCPDTDVWFTYNQISMATGSRFKQEAERYYLRERGQILYPGEKFVFNVYEPDIDIVKTEIRLMCDIFVKEDGGAEK